MKRREVAVVPHSGVATNKTLYSVRVRQRGWFGWHDWRTIVSGDRVCAWPYKDARALADQTLANGWVPGIYASEALPMVELDDE